jgi:hypothetical protein
MTPQTPERCGQRHVSIEYATTYTCDLAAGHRSEYHLDTGKLVTWSRAGDLVHHASMASAALVGNPVPVPHVCPDATIRSAVAGIIAQIDAMTAVFAELRDATCTGCPIVANSSNPEDGADIEPQPGCPVHGEVAELRRGSAWSAQQHERIAAALGPEYLAPFGPDVTAEAVRRIELLAEYQATHR